MTPKKTPFRPRDNSHIHSVDDHRGWRNVYLNGGLIAQCFYADTRKGIVRYYVSPLRVNKRRGDCAATRTKRGKVTVKWTT